MRGVRREENINLFTAGGNVGGDAEKAYDPADAADNFGEAGFVLGGFEGGQFAVQAVQVFTQGLVLLIDSLKEYGLFCRDNLLLNQCSLQWWCC